MSEFYRMPSLGADMKEGRVVEWFVAAGDPVRRGEVVGVVDTDKGAIEIEIWEDAVIEEIVVPPGRRVPVGEVLLKLSAPSEPRPRSDSEPGEAGSRVAAEAPAEPKAPMPGPAPPTPTSTPPSGPVAMPPSPIGVRASPAARREARSMGIDLAAIRGSGPDGAVVLEDVVRHSRGQAAPEQEPPVKADPGRRDPGGVHATPVARNVAESLGVELSGMVGTGPGGLVTKKDVQDAAVGEEEAAPPKTRTEQAPGPRETMRRAIAAAMARSKREIPHYYLSTSVSARSALRWLHDRNAELPPAQRLLTVSLFVKAVALALRDFPELNGHWVDEAYHPADGVHPGIAISLKGGGLVAPAIRDADGRSVEDLSGAIADLVNRARSERLRASEMTDPTVTVSSLGDRGVDSLFGVIYPPQVALVGVGRIAERPWADQGMLGVHPVANLTLSADHRVSDGHRGALFLDTVAELIQHPEDL